MTLSAIDQTAADKIAIWRQDPVLFVREALEAEPDTWQADVLDLVVEHPRVAMSACKGPGKSCVLAWVLWWFLSTHIDSQGIVLSITADNLRDGLWKELAFWRSKSTLLTQAFGRTAERIYSVDRPDTWWLSARSFPRDADKDQQASTLAGLHADQVIIVLDEIGGYPAGVLPAAEGIFANEHLPQAKPRLVVAGNPETTDGPLYDITTIDAHRWKVVPITGDPDDPKRSPRISKKWAQDQIDRWGRDSPWVRTNVLGLFPLVGGDKLIPLDKVMQAQVRDVAQHYFAKEAVIWGLDPAWNADGDEVALCRRQGVLCRRIYTWRTVEPIALAGKVAALLQQAEDDGEGPDAIFIDEGGGGLATAAHLRFLGWREVHTIGFGAAAEDERFENRRTEMWWAMAEWVKTGEAVLPTDPTLQTEMIAPKAGYEIVGKRTVFRLESKKAMKARGVKSPNRADALALTFASPISRMSRTERLARRRRKKTGQARDHKPFA